MVKTTRDNKKSILGQSIVMFWLLFFSTSNMAADTITVAVLEIPYLVSQDQNKKGLYNEFLDKLDNVKTTYAPPARSKMLFRRGSVNCIFPAGLTAYHVPFEIIQSQPIRIIKAYLYTNEPYSNVKLARENNIAIRRGFTFGGFRVNNPANYIDLDSDQSALKFLMRDRVDGVIGYHPDIELAAKESNIPLPFYAENKPIYTAKDAFVCRAEAKTRKFLRQINGPISQFRQRQQITD